MVIKLGIIYKKSKKEMEFRLKSIIMDDLYILSFSLIADHCLSLTS